MKKSPRRGVGEKRGTGEGFAIARHRRKCGRPRQPPLYRSPQCRSTWPAPTKSRSRTSLSWSSTSAPPSAPRAPARSGSSTRSSSTRRTASRAIPYEGEQGIGAVLEGMTRAGYQPFRERENGPAIALTLRPGDGLARAGRTVRALGDSVRDRPRGARREPAPPRRGRARRPPARAAARRARVPAVRQISEMPWMPKTRYRVMRESLPKRGKYALDMMLMTATGQVSLDWFSEEDCARKVTASARLSPLMVALYANSPLREGRPTGLMSFRSHVWTDVDPARCGYRPWMIDGSFRYRNYVDFALDAPLLFLRRDGQYLRAEAHLPRAARAGVRGQAGDVLRLHRPPLDALPRDPPEEGARGPRRRLGEPGDDRRAPGALARAVLRRDRALRGARAAPEAVVRRAPRVPRHRGQGRAARQARPAHARRARPGAARGRALGAQAPRRQGRVAARPRSRSAPASAALRRRTCSPRSSATRTRSTCSRAFRSETDRPSVERPFSWGAGRDGRAPLL